MAQVGSRDILLGRSREYIVHRMTYILRDLVLGRLALRFILGLTLSDSICLLLRPRFVH